MFVDKARGADTRKIKEVMMNKILTLKSLDKAFGGNTVLSGFNMEVFRGEILGLLGPNGSGKSTLLDTITGFTPLDAGEVIFNGQSIGRSPSFIRAQNGIRRTFQLPQMPEKMTVLEVLISAQPQGSGVFGSVFRGRRFRENEKTGRQKAMALLEQLSLMPVKDNRANEISGGQKKLLSIGCALMGEPELLLLDEPTAGVHPNVRSNLTNILKEINNSGITMIIIEHDMFFINSLCDRCVVLDRGQLIADCQPSELSSNPRVIQAYLGGSSDEIMSVQGVAV